MCVHLEVSYEVLKGGGAGPGSQPCLQLLLPFPCHDLTRPLTVPLPEWKNLRPALQKGCMGAGNGHYSSPPPPSDRKLAPGDSGGSCFRPSAHRLLGVAW